MSRICYVNNRYQPIEHLATPMQDRGLQFADGVYEVMEFTNRTVLHEDAHYARLEQSLHALDMHMPTTVAVFRHITQELMRRNRMQSGLIYLQVNRGVAPRDHLIPDVIVPTVMMNLMHPKTPSDMAIQRGITVQTAEDIRWARCDIKTVSLLGNVLLKTQAREAGAKEALLVAPETGVIREGSASNFFAVDAEGVLRTHPANHHILPGIIRQRVIELAKEAGMVVKETPITVADIPTLREAFVTSTSMRIMPVTRVDSHRLGDGKAGVVTCQLLTLLLNEINGLLAGSTGQQSWRHAA